jgi:hypothetical protein
MGKVGRQIIEDQFSVAAINEKTVAAYEDN